MVTARQYLSFGVYFNIFVELLAIPMYIYTYILIDSGLTLDIQAWIPAVQNVVKLTGLANYNFLISVCIDLC